MRDPTSEYLEPHLQGHRLHNGEYQATAADSTGGFFSEELGLVLRISDDELNFFDPTSNQRVLANSELATAEAEARQIEVETRRRAEAEVERLKAELARLQRPDHRQVLALSAWYLRSVVRQLRGAFHIKSTNKSDVGTRRRFCFPKS